MLRCPPTTIVLGRPDLLAYDKRKKGRKATDLESIYHQFARIAVGDPEGPLFGIARRVNRISSQDRTEGEDFIESNSNKTEETSSVSTTSGSHIAEEQGLSDTIPTDYSTENAFRSPDFQPSPMKNEFDYGGFIEDPRPQTADDSRHRASSSSRDDITTPHTGRQTDMQRLRSRALPRSPLFLSQNATSPEGRVTTGLTPRVVSRVATHHSPGIIFSQPPRRPPRATPRVASRISTQHSRGEILSQPPQRATPRTLRHQSNSFSFDSSERASAAYEQERVISNSTDDTTAHPSDDTRLHDELRGSSLQSSRISSGVPILLEPQNATASPRVEGQAEVEIQDFVFSSPGLPLPPPFSSVSRRTSNTDSLPSSTYKQFTHASPRETDTGSPSSNKDEAEDTEANLNLSSIIGNEAKESPPSGGRFGAFISRISRVASYRARSSLHLGASPSSSPPQIKVRRTSLNLGTPSRPYRVYNDNLSPDTQPQTPANLPEARHQSRYHPSYTAPVTRQASLRDTTSTTTTGHVGIGSSIRRRYQPVHTPVRAGSRNGSPTGMREEGFQGLYGGRENGDEEQNWVDGVRFNNVETRLWGERDARNNGEALRVTPEPEDWRIGRRN